MKSFLEYFIGEPEEESQLSSLARDIENLLNHTRSSQHWSVEDGASLLSYGVPTWVGKPMSTEVLKKLALDIKEALMLFEPRLEPSSIQVSPLIEKINSVGVYQLEIQAKLHDKFSVNVETDRVEWFVHIDHHYGLAKLCDQPMRGGLIT